MQFFLGTHQPGWLARTDVPLFVSRRRLCRYRALPKAQGPWALDSGAFTELQRLGQWGISAAWYVEEVRRWRAEVGNLQWAAPMDWPCEPLVISGGSIGKLTFAGTGLSVLEHQQRTVDNYLLLRDLAPELPWIPVLQGFEEYEYYRCWRLYESAGVDLANHPLVGLGSVCRRQGTGEAERLVCHLHADGLRLHLFGFKLSGLRHCARYAISADSLAWSYKARKNPPLPGCTHKRCANCLRYALWWRGTALAAVETSAAEGREVLF